MILSDTQILKELKRKRIIINPFDKRFLGCNSYDMHLGRHIKIYTEKVLDVKRQNRTRMIEIPEEGLVLKPGKVYLGVTEEVAGTKERYVAFVDGKSSVGRLGIQVHLTAGRGDVGFCNHWTLELCVQEPIRIYADIPICQIYFFDTLGKVKNPYNKKKDAKYNERNPFPVESMMWKNFLPENQ